MTRKALIASLFLAATAAPALAQDIPLNTLSGGDGVAQADGQAGLLAGSLGAGATVAVMAAVFVAVAANSGSDDSTND